MGGFEIEEANVAAKTGFFVTKKSAIIGLALFTAVIAGSVLVTYFSKPNVCESALGQCQSLTCQNPSLVPGPRVFFLGISFCGPILVTFQILYSSLARELCYIADSHHYSKSSSDPG
jgi:hypothetical protein